MTAVDAVATRLFDARRGTSLAADRPRLRGLGHHLCLCRRRPRRPSGLAWGGPVSERLHRTRHPGASRVIGEIV